MNALEVDRAHAPQGYWSRRLGTAFLRSEGWEEFHDAALRLGATRTWVQNHSQALRLQTAVRHLLPQHHSTSGAEATAQRLRNLYEQRSFSLRNAARTNLLLGLTRLHLNNRDVNPTRASCAKRQKRALVSPAPTSASTATPAPRTARRSPHSAEMSRPPQAGSCPPCAAKSSRPSCASKVTACRRRRPK
jgi:hypothetical protein